MRTTQWGCGLLSLCACLWLVAIPAHARAVDVTVVQPSRSIDVDTAADSTGPRGAPPSLADTDEPGQVDVPALTSRVVDLAGVLDTGESEALRDTITRIEDETQDRQDVADYSFRAFHLSHHR